MMMGIGNKCVENVFFALYLARFELRTRLSVLCSLVKTFAQSFELHWLSTYQKPKALQFEGIIIYKQFTYKNKVWIMNKYQLQ